jgi:hypothetical protein
LLHLNFSTLGVQLLSINIFVLFRVVKEKIIENLERNSRIANRNKEKLENFQKIFESDSEIDWQTILAEIEPTQMVHISELLSASKNETFKYGHQFNELFVLCDFDHEGKDFI